MHADAKDLLKGAQFAIISSHLLLSGHHGVYHDLEGHKEAPLREQKYEEQTADVSMIELIDDQVSDDASLRNKQCLLFTPAWNDFVVGPDPHNHVEYHHSSLKDHPALLESIASRVLIHLVVEVFILYPAGFVYSNILLSIRSSIFCSSIAFCQLILIQIHFILLIIYILKF